MDFVLPASSCVGSNPLWGIEFGADITLLLGPSQYIGIHAIAAH